MEYSEHYGFALPQDEDFYDISPMSENFDQIDEILAEREAQMNDISEKIGAPAENGQTVFSLLEKSGGNSIIKSLQHKTLSYTNTTDTGEIAIDPVDLNKTIFLLERQYDYGGCSNIVYTTYRDKIVLDLPTSHGRVGFWIIEFY